MKLWLSEGTCHASCYILCTPLNKIFINIYFLICILSLFLAESALQVFSTKITSFYLCPIFICSHNSSCLMLSLSNIHRSTYAHRRTLKSKHAHARTSTYLHHTHTYTQVLYIYSNLFIGKDFIDDILKGSKTVYMLIYHSAFSPTLSNKWQFDVKTIKKGLIDTLFWLCYSRKNIYI